MTPPLRTLGLFGFAVALLGTGYMLRPSPAATTPLPASQAAAAVPATPAPVPTVAAASAAPAAAPTLAVEKASALVSSRAPVPLVTRTHTNFFGPPVAENAQAGALGTAAPGTSPDGKPTDPATGAPASSGVQQANATVETKPGEDSQAKAAIEFDGYRNVSGLVKEPDGSWRGKAMRGRTQIAIRVNPDGSVSQD